MKLTNLYAFLITLFAFGFLVPYFKGLEFLDPFVLAISCFIPLVFVAPMVAPDVPAAPLSTRLWTSILFAFALSLLILVNAIVTVNVSRRFGHVFVPSVALLAGLIAASGTAATFIALASALLLRSGSPSRARQAVRIALFVLLGLYLYLSRFAPPQIRDAFNQNITTGAFTGIAWTAASVLTAVDAILWFGPVRRLAAQSGTEQRLHEPSGSR